MIEFIKYITPFLIFVAGVYAAPFIEGLKSKRILKDKIDNIYAELEDEYSTIIKSIKTTNNSILSRIGKPASHIHLSLAMSLDLRVTSDNYKDVYSSLSKDLRNGLKVLLLCRETILQNRSDIELNYREDNLLCLSKERAMLKSMLSSYYLLNEIVTNRNSFIYPKISNQEIWDKAAASLGIRLI